MSDSVASLSHRRGRGIPLRLASDERLTGLVAQGNKRAFAVLYQRHHAALYRYCRAIVRHEQDAQDVLQTTMVRALSALGRAMPDAPVRPWLFRIAHNEAISVLRRRQATRAIDEAHAIEGRPLESRLDERDRLARLVADLNELPERQRGALVMRELSGLSHEEIAASLGITVGAAKQAIFDARTGLHEFERGRVMGCAEIQRLVSDGDGRVLRGRPVRAHLRACDSCCAMRDAIRMRAADLALLAPPLPALAASGLLAKILGAGGGHGGAGGAGGVTTIAVAGKTGTTVVAGKAIATVVLVATVGVGADRTLSSAPTGRAPAAPATASRAAERSGPGTAESAAASATRPGAGRATARAALPGRMPAAAGREPAPGASSSARAKGAAPAAGRSGVGGAAGKAGAAASARRAGRPQRTAGQAGARRRATRPAGAGAKTTRSLARRAPATIGSPAPSPGGTVPVAPATGPPAAALRPESAPTASAAPRAVPE